MPGSQAEAATLLDAYLAGEVGGSIAVHGADGGEQVGWVPRELAAELAGDLDAGRPWSAVVLRERRLSPRDPRSGVTMLLAPEPAIELHVHDRRPPRRTNSS